MRSTSTPHTPAMTRFCVSGWPACFLGPSPAWTAPAYPHPSSRCFPALARLTHTASHPTSLRTSTAAIYPTTIRRRALRHLYLEPVKGCYLFRKCSRRFLDALITAARVELFLPGVEVCVRAYALYGLPWKLALPAAGFQQQGLMRARPPAAVFYLVLDANPHARTSLLLILPPFCASPLYRS